MPTLNIDGLSFTFPEGWQADKYDEWAFYRGHFAKQIDGLKGVLKCAVLRVVAHIEQPRAHRPVVDPADIKQQLRRKLRAVDAHPKIVSMNDMQGLAWNVM